MGGHGRTWEDMEARCHVSVCVGTGGGGPRGPGEVQQSPMGVPANFLCKGMPTASPTSLKHSPCLSCSTGDARMEDDDDDTVPADAAGDLSGAAQPAATSVPHTGKQVEFRALGGKKPRHYVKQKPAEYVTAKVCCAVCVLTVCVIVRAATCWGVYASTRRPHSPNPHCNATPPLPCSTSTDRCTGRSQTGRTGPFGGGWSEVRRFYRLPTRTAH
jgi:hypothetical protein